MAKGRVEDEFVQGEHNRCPHCGAISRVLPHDDLRWVCGVCGGPRIPLDPGDELTEDGARALREANDARSAAIAWRLASFASGFGALLGLGLGAVLVLYSLVAAIGPAIVGALLVLLALRFRSNSRARGAAARGAWERAWAAEVDDMLSAEGGSLTPAQIARKVKVPEEEIGAIVARLSAEDRVRVDVGEDAQLHVRSSALPPSVVADLEARARSEAEAEADAAGDEGEAARGRKAP